MVLLVGVFGKMAREASYLRAESLLGCRWINDEDEGEDEEVVKS
jgi:hypothetical protein